MTKAESVKEFKENLIIDIESGQVEEIYNLNIGAIKFMFYDIDTPLEIKRFLHIFKQCDLLNSSQTCELLNRAGFIKDIKFRYLSLMTPFQNLKCFLMIQAIRFNLHCISFLGGEKTSL